MAILKDNQKREWTIELDAPLVEEVNELHQIELTNLENDPLLKMRNNPLVAVAVAYVLCREQIEKLGITPQDFGKACKSIDAILEAVKEAIINFSHSGRASHVREVLTKFEEMAAMTDSLAAKKMAQVMSDPKTATRLNGKADKLFDDAMREMFPLNSELGT